MTVFDVTDPNAPAVASQTTFDGSFHDARAVDGVVYLVLDTRSTFRNCSTPTPPVEPGEVAGDPPRAS